MKDLSTKEFTSNPSRREISRPRDQQGQSKHLDPDTQDYHNAMANVAYGYWSILSLTVAKDKMDQ